MPQYAIAPPTADESKLAKASSETIKRMGKPKNFKIIVNGKEVKLPGAAFQLLQGLLAAMAEGDAVALTSIHGELTTQEAADLLGVSRPFLIKQLEAGALPSHKTGSHRRIYYRDLMDYKQRMRKRSLKALEKLAEEGQKMGIGY